MPSVAIQGSSVATGHPCDGSTVLATPGQGSVYIGGVLAARLGDLTVSHAFKVGDDCVPHVAAINGSSSTVYVAGVLVARLGDGCDLGSITSGNGSNVYAN
jgi:uncharacterized Zn-binding protein involved in type VI secretion